MSVLCKASHRSPQSNKDIDTAVPTTSGEEELQLQLALAMSKEEHEEEMKRQKADELKLQLAIEESKKTARTGSVYSEVLSPCCDYYVGFARKRMFLSTTNLYVSYSKKIVSK